MFIVYKQKDKTEQISQYQADMFFEKQDVFIYVNSTLITRGVFL